MMDADALMLRVRPEVARMARERASGNEALAEDLEQWGMVAAYEAIPKLKPWLDPMPYLKGAARFAIQSKARDLTRHAADTYSLDAPLGDEGEALLEDTVGEADRGTSADVLAARALLEVLHPAQARAILLRTVQRLTIAEAASREKVSRKRMAARIDYGQCKLALANALPSPTRKPGSDVTIISRSCEATFRVPVPPVYLETLHRMAANLDLSAAEFVRSLIRYHAEADLGVTLPDVPKPGRVPRRKAAEARERNRRASA